MCDRSETDETLLTKQKIHKISREIKKQELSLYSCLRSIEEDLRFVEEVRNWYKGVPTLANLRCGLWYTPKAEGTCYFKSTDGHNNNWSFSLSRLNLHVAKTASANGGCVVVDATRKGKKFPDAMNKTIPIWTTVLNRAICLIRTARPMQDSASDERKWDTELHLPIWVSSVERNAIEARMDSWVQSLIQVASEEILELSNTLHKPLRPLWISQSSTVWLNEIPEVNEYDFHPIVLVSASKVTPCPRRESDWVYIPGAGDDEESWAEGLQPQEFHAHRWELMDAGPLHTSSVVASIAQKGGGGHNVAQSLHGQDRNLMSPFTRVVDAHHPAPTGCLGIKSKTIVRKTSSFTVIGDTGVAVGGRASMDVRADLAQISGIIDLRTAGEEVLNNMKQQPGVLHAPVRPAKFDKHGVERALTMAVPFALKYLQQRESVLVVCDTGVDNSVCVAIAILLQARDLKSTSTERKCQQITKSMVQEYLAMVCSYCPFACPTRAGLRQVYNFCLRA